MQNAVFGIKADPEQYSTLVSKVGNGKAMLLQELFQRVGPMRGGGNNWHMSSFWRTLCFHTLGTSVGNKHEQSLSTGGLDKHWDRFE